VRLPQFMLSCGVEESLARGIGEGRRFARSANAHLVDDETVAKMGHPTTVVNYAEEALGLQSRWPPQF
jgi:hypothetical protein